MFQIKDIISFISDFVRHSITKLTKCYTSYLAKTSLLHLLLRGTVLFFEYRDVFFLGGSVVTADRDQASNLSHFVPVEYNM